MKTIQLTQDKHALVDDEDFERLNQFKWCCAQGYATRQGNTKMARVIMGEPKGKIVDHRNGDTLDNRRSNLRVCTKTENMRNRKYQPSSSNYKGVGLHVGKYWRAQIRDYSGRKKHLGLFKSPEEAAKVYNAAAIRYFGQFARINDIKE